MTSIAGRVWTRGGAEPPAVRPRATSRGLAADLWDDESWYRLASSHVRIARETGALSEPPLALNSRVFVHLFAGELGAAESLVTEIPALKQATASDLASYGAMGLVALQGSEAQAHKLIGANLTDVVSRGEGIGVTVAHWSRAVLYNGLRRFQEALVDATQAGRTRGSWLWPTGG